MSNVTLQLWPSLSQKLIKTPLFPLSSPSLSTTSIALSSLCPQPLNSYLNHSSTMLSRYQRRGPLTHSNLHASTTISRYERAIMRMAPPPPPGYLQSLAGDGVSMWNNALSDGEVSDEEIPAHRQPRTPSPSPPPSPTPSASPSPPPSPPHTPPAPPPGQAHRRSSSPKVRPAPYSTVRRAAVDLVPREVSRQHHSHLSFR